MESANDKIRPRRWKLLMGIPATLFCLVFGGFILFDLGTGVVMNVALHRTAEKTLDNEKRPVPRTADGKIRSVAPTSTGYPGLSSSESTTASLLCRRAEYGLQTLPRVLRSIANTSATSTNISWEHVALIPSEIFKTPEFNQQARVINETYRRVLCELYEYCESEAWRDEAHELERLKQIEQECNWLRLELERATRSLVLESSVAIKNSKDLPSAQLRLATDSDVWMWKKNFSSLCMYVESAQVMVCVAHRWWVEAANLLRYGHEAENWKNEVFFLSQMGARGQALIARRSAERNWTALKRSVMSIGPEFKWPYRERTD